MDSDVDTLLANTACVKPYSKVQKRLVGFGFSPLKQVDHVTMTSLRQLGLVAAIYAYALGVSGGLAQVT